ncbi:unnamed protein product, partial [Candidula unifasciata]
PSNNLSQSRLSYTHGYVAGPSMKSLVTVSGHLARPEPRYQAVAMRSPQQSSRYSSAANINLFRPDSPHCISSPPGHTTNHWSPPGNVTIQHHPSVPALTAGSISSPGRTATNQTLFIAETPVKRGRPRRNQQTRQIGEFFVFFLYDLNDNLSPPVKQPAERDHSSDSANEASSGSLDASRLGADFSQLSSHMEDHQNRQGELQHYVRMLLQKAPGSVCSEPERDRQYSDPEILESSRDLTVDLDLTDTATAEELTSQLNRLQQLRKREQQATRTVVSRNPRMQPPPSTSQSNESLVSQLSEFFDDTGIISSQRLSEISRVINLYRDPEIAGQVSVTSQLLDTLKEATASASAENVSGKDDRKQQGAKMSPPSQQTRKVKDLTKARRVRSESQSADSSIAVSGCSLDNSTSGKSATHGPPRKSSQPTESIKDKKSGSVKHPGGKSSGGPAWK